MQYGAEGRIEYQRVNRRRADRRDGGWQRAMESTLKTRSLKTRRQAVL